MNISKIIVDGKINWDYVKPMVSNYYEGSENLIRCFEHSYSINEKKEWLSQYKPSSNRKYNDGVNTIAVKFFNNLIETNDYKKTIAIVFKSNIKINSFRCNLTIIRRIAFLFCNENIIANDIFLLIWNIDKDKNVLEKVVNNVREMPFFSKDEVRTILLGYQKFFNWLEKNKNGMYREIVIKDMLRFSMSFFCGLRYDSSISKIRWKNIKDEYI